MSKGKKYDLQSYAVSKQVCNDLPKLIKFYEGFIKILQPYRHYTGVAHVLELTEDSMMLLKTQLKLYKNIQAKKGEVNEQ